MIPDKPAIAARLQIRRNSDGVIRESSENWDFFGDFIWSDGNFACDCNRSDFFARAGGESEEDDPACGHTAFSVRLLAVDDGRVLYEDDDWNRGS